MSNLLINAKKWIWKQHGTNLKKYNQVKYTAHPPNYFVDSFPKYIEGKWIETEQYWFSIINLDFYPLIQLREKLFVAYGQMFLNDKLFFEINYRIYYLVDFATAKMKSELDLYSEDVEYLAKQKVEIINLLNENDERLTKYKYQYVNTLNSHNLVLFNEHFYTYSKIYEDIVQNLEMRIYMYTFHYDRNTGTFPEIYLNTPPTFDEFKAGQITTIDENIDISFPTIIKASSNKIKKLQTNKSFEFIYNLFFLIVQTGTFETDNLKGFIYKLFDFENIQYDDIDIPFKIGTNSEVAGAFFYDLRTRNIITNKSYQEVCKIIDSLKLKNYKNITIKASSLRAASNETLNTYIENGKNILTDEIFKKLSSKKK
jgi:hypothetical protein